MLVIEGKCPQCHGNLVLSEKDKMYILACESCSYREETKDRQVYLTALAIANEWGPKEKRLTPTPAGKLIYAAQNNGGLLTGVGIYLGETLIEGVRGLVLEDYELEQLLKWGLVENGRS